MYDPSSFANPTPLAHADTSRDVLPRGEPPEQSGLGPEDVLGVSEALGPLESWVSSNAEVPEGCHGWLGCSPSGRPIFDDFFQHLYPYIGNNTANVVFQMVKSLWLIRIVDQ
ncbi:hypothetical protein TNCV_665461 [Trichonephila clavipes]|uniref:Uncharacterized protein n=1 Tax=Trichonephila clavipes TaxID=2585209 RepID=A0A8X6VN90_TRICX|nr:hypothetical protein TNCV_665461 [Trichonephila clavipes]